MRTSEMKKESLLKRKLTLLKSPNYIGLFCLRFYDTFAMIIWESIPCCISGYRIGNY